MSHPAALVGQIKWLRSCSYRAQKEAMQMAKLAEHNLLDELEEYYLARVLYYLEDVAEALDTAISMISESATTSDLRELIERASRTEGRTPEEIESRKAVIEKLKAKLAAR